uniref:Conserved oligomeric Golgi complex subunit 2 n=1 Tax=Blastobotrys adeninivorans TaxID=409370 RepID=A0A060SXF3_BLAAD
MEDYFGDDSGPLPSAKIISRDEFSVDNFSVEAFVNSHRQYQTLNDLQQQLRQWAQTLNQELVDIINEDYGDFVGLAKSLSGGEAKAMDVKVELLGFRREVEQTKDAMGTSSKEITRLVEQKRRLEVERKKVRRQLLFITRLKELECWENGPLADRVKVYLALKKVQDGDESAQYEEYKERLETQRQKVIQDIKDRLQSSDRSNGDEIVRLLDMGAMLNGHRDLVSSFKTQIQA